MTLSGADIIVKTLIDEGVDVVFGYPGGQIINVYDSLYKYQDEIRHVLTAHEQGASHAADGYARATGKVGVVIATSGPGATNLVTGISTAYLDSIPMVAITGNVPTTSLGTDSFQEIDITGITLPVTKHNYIVGDISELQETIHEAFALAASGKPGPVLIDVPKDIQIAKYEYEPLPKAEKAEAFAAKDARIEEAAAIINASDRPFVYFGGGVLAADAEDLVTAIADKIDAPIGCSLMGITGVPTDHPRFLGMQGMHGHYASSISMSHADCIISLGVRFNDRVTGNRKKFALNTSIVQIDIDGAELGKTTSPAVALRGDVKKTLEKLLPLLKERKNPHWMSRVDEFKVKEKSGSDTRPGMTPKAVMDVVNTHLTPATPVATDVGQHQMWAAQYLKFSEPRRFLTSGGLGTMGFGMGAAIGGVTGTGNHGLLVTGDGSFGMCLNELATAVHENVPLVILLLNNGVLGMVRQWQTLFFDKHYSNTVLDRQTDFVKLAEAFGAKGKRISSLEELDTALTEAFDYDGPFLIECPIGKDEMVLPMLPPNGSMDQIITEVKQ